MSDCCTSGFAASTLKKKTYPKIIIGVALRTSVVLEIAKKKTNKVSWFYNISSRCVLVLSLVRH